MGCGLATKGCGLDTLTCGLATTVWGLAPLTCRLATTAHPVYAVIVTLLTDVVTLVVTVLLIFIYMLFISDTKTICKRGGKEFLDEYQKTILMICIFINSELFPWSQLGNKVMPCIKNIWDGLSTKWLGLWSWNFHSLSQNFFEYKRRLQLSSKTFELIPWLNTSLSSTEGGKGLTPSVEVWGENLNVRDFQFIA